jgi:hypothetical protein
MHYLVEFSWANPELILISTQKKNGWHTYHYNTNALEGAGDCDCPHFAFKIRKKRSRILQNLINQGKNPNTMPEQTRALSGTCRHEDMALHAIAIRNTVAKVLASSFPDTRPSPTDIIRLASKIHELHARLQIQTFHENDLAWIAHATAKFFEALSRTGPCLDGKPMPLPNWVLKNQKLLNRAGELAEETMRSEINGQLNTLSQTLLELQAWLSKHVRNALQAGTQPNQTAYATDFFTNEKPWLHPAMRAALKHIAGCPEEKQPPIPIPLSEALKKFGGKAEQFLETYAG